ncbi:MAG: major capsid protein [Microviridae sp.]|nr:MAG: major capsid protein [Microviridae sp.]
MNVGTLYPIYVQEVYPGDTFKVKPTFVCRSTSPFVKPVMDNLFIDQYFFFVPHRIVDKDFETVIGAVASPSEWTARTERTVPCLNMGANGVTPGGVADYLGLPLGCKQTDISIYPFRAFAKVFDDWFRDENNVPPMLVQTGDIASSEVLNDNAWAPNNYTGKLPKVAKMHDYFTSCLPNVYKGDTPVIPVEMGASQDIVGAQKWIPVHSLTQQHENIIGTGFAPLGFSTDGTFSPGDYNLFSRHSSYGVPGVLNIGQENSQASAYEAYPNNLWANVTGSGITSVDIIQAMALQRMLANDARGGTRYTEILQSHFGVMSPDQRLQRSEFLGGKRLPLSVTQVAQTGATTENNPLADLAGYSQSVGQSKFSKGFVEHGFIIGVACIRYFHSYQQGVERFWTRNERLDFYDPAFANITEQPVYKSELYSTGSVTGDSTSSGIFGYQEAWADLRNRRNYITGQMRSNKTGISLDIWHFADNYTSAPVLGEAFIDETPTFVDRTLSVSSDKQDQFIIDLWFDVSAIRVLPVYSIPRL